MTSHDTYGEFSFSNFTYFWSCWVLPAARTDFFPVAASRGCSLVATLWFLIAVASLVSGSIVLHWLSCSVACGIFSKSGIEPVSSALAGGFFFFYH